MRPQYETSHDRAGEEAVIKAALPVLKADYYRKLPLAYRADYALMRGADVFGFAEVKCRNKRYSTLILSLHKYLTLLDFIRAGFVCFVLVRWPEGMFAYRVSLSDNYHVKWSGRNDRGDWQDTEPCVHLPTGKFTKIENIGETV